MKKILLTVISICVIFGMTACGNNQKNSQKQDESSTSTEIVVASGSSSVPNSYVENGVHKGQEVDIWNAISKKTGLKVKFITGDFDTLFGYLDSGKADTVGNTITINAKRRDKYNFSERTAIQPFFERKYSKKYYITEGSLLLMIKFMPNGNLNGFGTIFIRTKTKTYRLTFLIGRGRFYVTEQ